MRRLLHLVLLGITLTGPALGAGEVAVPGTDEQTDGRAQPSPYSSVIRFLTDNDYPPFNYVDEEGTLTGFNIDMARAVCLELNVSCDIQTAGWDQLLPTLERGETDAVIASIAITPATRAEADFTDRYYTTPGRFVTRKDSQDTDITPTGIEGRRVGVVTRTAHEAYLQTYFRDSIITGYETPDEARDALLKGDVDLLFGDGFSLMFWLNGASSKACCEFRGGPFADDHFFGEGIGVAVRHGDSELKGLINKALKKVRESGRYEELFLRYFPLRIY